MYAQCAFLCACVRVCLQTPVVYVGRVVVDGEGKINHSSVLLEGNCQGDNASVVPTARVLLDLRDVPGFSLFPGQVRFRYSDFLSRSRTYRVLSCPRFLLFFAVDR
jgi:hypothetical protein